MKPEPICEKDSTSPEVSMASIPHSHNIHKVKDHSMPQGVLRNFSRLFVFFLLPAMTLLEISCSTPEPLLAVDAGSFEISSTKKTDFYRAYRFSNVSPRALSGRASVQIRHSGESDRLSIHFQANRTHSLIRLRNHLGIEGGRIYADADSVIIYNRLEQMVHKMSHTDASMFYLQGVSAMNLLHILDPFDGPESIRNLYENDEYFLVETILGDWHYVERDPMLLRQTTRSTSDPGLYSQFIFDRYLDWEGIQIPSRINILSSDEKSNIFMVIRSLEVNPSGLEFDPGIPGELDIIRI